MLAYFESSVILAIILEEASIAKAMDLWKNYPNKISSAITEIECFNNLFGAKKNLSRKKGDDWFLHKRRELEDLLSEIKIQNLNPEIVNLIRTNETLSENRTLDCLHVSTAYFLSLKIKEQMTMVSFDKEIVKLSRVLGFQSWN